MRQDGLTLTAAEGAEEEQEGERREMEVSAIAVNGKTSQEFSFQNGRNEYRGEMTGSYFARPDKKVCPLPPFPDKAVFVTEGIWLDVSSVLMSLSARLKGNCDAFVIGPFFATKRPFSLLQDVTGQKRSRRSYLIYFPR